MIYGMLVTLSTAIYTTVATLWQVQQTLINWMMSFSLFILGLFCKPYLVVPLLAAGFFMVRRILLRRQSGPKPGNRRVTTSLGRPGITPLKPHHHATRRAPCPIASVTHPRSSRATDNHTIHTGL
ncbi:uncharacterized protein LOC117194165 [Drosophila miranda]|uniref:uncharacterized protein LOC117194165 n=1 Tax=Drosophila miranda TaxID=7229 RepID=UPI00143F2B8B|nr:uncharacterized protein LOC117194165 [Drosophila miranda]